MTLFCYTQVVNVELHNIMRLAGRTLHRYHSPINATLLHRPDADPWGDTLLRQMGHAEVDVPGSVAAIEAAAMQAGFNQTDRVGDTWNSWDPVNASMYPLNRHHCGRLCALGKGVKKGKEHVVSLAHGKRHQ